jgi:hypothetical protein
MEDTLNLRLSKNSTHMVCTLQKLVSFAPQSALASKHMSLCEYYHIHKYTLSQLQTWTNHSSQIKWKKTKP